MKDKIKEVLQQYQSEDEEELLEKDASLEATKRTLGARERICPMCGKVFLKAPYHSYRMYHSRRLVCTYSCALRSEREQINIK